MIKLNSADSAAKPDARQAGRLALRLRAALRWLAFVTGALLVTSALLKLLFPALLFWAVDPVTNTALPGGAAGLPVFVLIGSSTGALVQALFPYSLPITIGLGIALATPKVVQQRRARARVLGLACMFTAAACLSHISIWKNVTPQLPGPMLVSGLLAAALATCALLIWERDALHNRIRAAASRQALDADDALADIERRLSRADQTESMAQMQLRETAAQDERNRLARDLHDTIKQQLFSINMAAATAQTLAQTDPDAAMGMVQEVRNLSQQAQVEMKALLTQLRPAPLATVGLVQAIGDQLEALHFRSEVKVEFSGELPKDESRLPIGAQEAIFRVTQEALSNIARHARASRASVSLNPTESQLTVRIADDGQGFDPASVGAGMGLSNMRTRIADVGGSLAVQSAPGAGTVIEITLPLSTQAPALPEDSRHYLLDRFYGTVQANAVSVVLTMLCTIIAGGFAYAVSQGAQNAAQSTPPPGDAFTNSPLLLFGLIGLLLASAIAVPVLAIVLQVVVRKRRSRLKKLAGGVQGWGDAFLKLLHLDDKWYLMTVCVISAVATMLGRGFAPAPWSNVLVAFGALALAGAAWLLIRLVQEVRELRDSARVWGTPPWLRARVGELILSTAYLSLWVIDALSGSAWLSAGALSTPTDAEQLTEMLVSINTLFSLVIMLASAYFLIHAARANAYPSSLPGVGAFGLTRADRISLTLQAVVYAVVVALHLYSPELEFAVLLLTLSIPVIFGLTRAATPLREAAARFKDKL